MMSTLTGRDTRESTILDFKEFKTISGLTAIHYFTRSSKAFSLQKELHHKSVGGQEI